jgi:hypothetical protein
MQTIRILAHASCIAILALAHEHAHAGNDAGDLPYGFMSSVTALSNARVQCSENLPSTSPRRAKCTIVQTLLTRPGPDKVARDIAELDKALSGTAGAKFLTDACGSQKSRDQAPATTAPTARENLITAALLDACRKGEVSAMRQAMKDRIKFDSEVCTVETITDEYEFTRTNQDTWTFASAPGAWCGGFTMVLWRDAKNKHLWNYKQVRSPAFRKQTDPFGLGLCAEVARAPLTELTSHDAPIRQLDCRYIKL